MSTIEYTYRILSVGERTMDVEYSSPEYGVLLVGVRRPKLGETTEQVIAEYSPVGWWLERAAEFESVAEGTQGVGATEIPEPPAPLTPEEELELWRSTAVISQLQAHYTLQAWGLYDQVLAVVQMVGDPVELAFNRAIEWRRTSPTLQSLFANVTLADGSTPTAEDLDQFFLEAQGFQV